MQMTPHLNQWKITTHTIQQSNNFPQTKQLFKNNILQTHIDLKLMYDS